MSNLKFRTPAHPVKLAEFLGNRQERELCYATKVYRNTHDHANYQYRINHHGNAIGFIGTYAIEVSNAGHASATTRTRLNKILRDNGIPARICQHQYVQCLEFLGATYTDFRWAQFKMLAGEWRLTDGQYQYTVRREGSN